MLFTFLAGFNKNRQSRLLLTIRKKSERKSCHLLKKNNAGLELCVGCGLCDRICPSGAIFVQSAPSREENPISTDESYAAEYLIDIGSCIFCGLCEQACSTGALVLISPSGFAVDSKLDLHRRKSCLLSGSSKNKLSGAD